MACGRRRGTHDACHLEACDVGGALAANHSPHRHHAHRAVQSLQGRSEEAWDMVPPPPTTTSSHKHAATAAGLPALLVGLRRGRPGTAPPSPTPPLTSEKPMMAGPCWDTEARATAGREAARARVCVCVCVRAGWGTLPPLPLPNGAAHTHAAPHGCTRRMIRCAPTSSHQPPGPSELLPPPHSNAPPPPPPRPTTILTIQEDE